MKFIPYVLAALLAASTSPAQNVSPTDGAMSMTDMDMPGMQMDEDAQSAVPATLKTMFERADKPLTVAPVVVQGNWAIAGWRQDGRGGRVLLKRGHQGFRIYLCSGDDILDPAVLRTFGLSLDDASTLAANLKNAEGAFDPKVRALFASFEGTVVIASDTESDNRHGHEGHVQ